MAAAAGAASVGPTGAAEPAPQATKAALSDKFGAAAKAVLDKRAAAKAAAAAPAADSPAPAAPAAQAPTAAATPPAASTPTPATPGSDAKPDAAPDAGIIDLASQGTPTASGDDDEAHPTELSEADAGDLAKVKAKLEEAHKDNAKQRKLKREAAEAAEALKTQLADLQKQLETAQQSATSPAGGRYLDRFSKLEDVQRAHADARATLDQLVKTPDATEVTLPGGRKWSLVDADGQSFAPQAAETALEIIDTYEARTKELQARSDAERLVAEKLPVLSKAVPDFEQRYQRTLKADWRSEAPKLSLNAALGELVTSGDYVLVPRGKAASQAKASGKDAAPAAPAAKPDLPTMTPPVRSVEAGQEDLSHLREKALKGDQKALAEWIKKSGKPKQAA